jgi:hypothetical protein
MTSPVVKNEISARMSSRDLKRKEGRREEKIQTQYSNHRNRS